MNEYELTAVKAVESFLKSELDEYSYFKWKIVETEYYKDEVFIDTEINDKTIRFRAKLGDGNPEDCKLFVDMHEDNWNQVATYNWRVKYFWMALLEW